jgi:hypothetical protein
VPGKGFSAHVPTLHENANRIGQRADQVSQAGSSASGAGLHGSALGIVGESTAAGHQELASRVQSAVGNAGERLHGQSALLHQTGQNITATDTEHSERLSAIEPNGNTPSVSGGSPGEVGGMPGDSRRRRYAYDSYRPSSSSQTSASYRPSSSRPSSSYQGPSRIRPSSSSYQGPSSSSSSRYRPSSSLPPRRRPVNTTYRPTGVRPTRPSAPARPVSPYRPPGSVVSLQSFADRNGTINYPAARSYMQRHYPQLQGVNLANYQAGRPGHNTNCGPVTVAADASIRDGRTYPAVPSYPVRTTDLEMATNSAYRPMNSYNAATQAMVNEPNGARGSMFINHANTNVGHFFNVHRDGRGVINYIDAQNYLPANTGTNPSDIRYMRHNT